MAPKKSAKNIASPPKAEVPVTTPNAEAAEAPVADVKVEAAEAPAASTTAESAKTDHVPTTKAEQVKMCAGLLSEVSEQIAEDKKALTLLESSLRKIQKALPKEKKVTKGKSQIESPTPTPDTSSFAVAVAAGPVSVSDMVAAAIEAVQSLKKSSSAQDEKVKRASRGISKKVPTRAPTQNRASGFAKPTKLAPALKDFLGLADDVLMSRTDVTRSIHKYVKENNLQSPDDKRNIMADGKLLALLNINKDVPLNYFTLQTYIRPLFVKD